MSEVSSLRNYGAVKLLSNMSRRHTVDLSLSAWNGDKKVWKSPCGYCYVFDGDNAESNVNGNGGVVEIQASIDWTRIATFEVDAHRTPHLSHLMACLAHLQEHTHLRQPSDHASSMQFLQML